MLRLDNSCLTIFSSSIDGRNRARELLFIPGILLLVINGLSSANRLTFVTLSLRVGNIYDTKGELPSLAETGLKFANIGRISFLGLYYYRNLNVSLHINKKRSKLTLEQFIFFKAFFQQKITFLEFFSCRSL